ncbi:MAG TPA: hypothetical protein VK538_07760 [Solirubrobacteraceae bacterium]|nr:hypothetical protein [Solirubrobacteraceae bacterium]
MEKVERLRRHAARNWVSALMLLALLAAGAVSVAVTSSDAPHRKHGARAAAPAAASDPKLRAALAAALTTGVDAANRIGGQASAGIWLEGWPQPITAPASRYARLWSLAKPVAAIAAYQAWEARRGAPTGAIVTAAEDAITRSDNCGERYLVLELNALTGGSDAGRRAFEGVLSRAGVRVDSHAVPEHAGEARECARYLARRAPIADPIASGWQFGIDEWNVLQAVSFAHALGARRYGRAGEAVLDIMSRLKQPELASLEGPTGNHLVDLQWGAGDAFGLGQSAYKAGWGGSGQHDFVAAQIVVLPHASPPVALAAIFRPTNQPSNDDLGATRAPEALRALFGRVAHELRRQHVMQ